MTTTQLAELLLARLYELAEQQGHDTYFDLEPIAVDLGVDDKGKLLHVARFLEGRGLIRAIHTFRGSSGLITGEGAVLVEGGGTTGVIDAYRANPASFLRAVPQSFAVPQQNVDSTFEILSGLVVPILDADLVERHGQFFARLASITNEFAQQGRTGGSDHRAAITNTAREELRVRSDLIYETWAHVLRAHVDALPSLGTQELLEAAKSRLSAEAARLEETLQGLPWRGPTGQLDESLRLLSGKLQSRLKLAVQGGIGQLAVATATTPSDLPRSVFLVHGHDQLVRESVARFLERAGLAAIILHEQASRGDTIIEKLEANADVGFAIVLLTPDDLGRAKDDLLEQPRARQNVIFEMGYFFALLGRRRVCAIYGDVELPTDLSGVVYIRFDDTGAWRVALARELRAAGLEVDIDTALF